MGLINLPSGEPNNRQQETLLVFFKIMLATTKFEENVNKK